MEKDFCDDLSNPLIFIHEETENQAGGTTSPNGPSWWEQS